MKIKEIFGKNVKKYRDISGISQEKLGEIAGLHRTYIGAVERGERNITLVNAEKIAIALNIEFAKLLTNL